MDSVEYQNPECLLGVRSLSRWDAARILRIPVATLWRWLEGYRRGAVTYRPILRPEPTGDLVLTWGEFLEAGWVTEYRRNHSVPLRQLRRYLNARRTQDGKRYPLAYRQPFVVPSKSLADYSITRDGDELMVRWKDGQIVLDPRAEAFISHVRFPDIGDDDVTAVIRQWLPEPEKFPDVKVDPLYYSGRPNIRGIRTEILHEFVTAGDTVEWLAQVYEMEPQLIQQASDFESTLERARAA